MKWLTPILSIALICCLASCSRSGPPAPKTELLPKAEAFVDRMAAGEFEAAVGAFDAVMSAVMSADKLEEAWVATVAEAGAYVGRVGSESIVDQGYNIVLVTCQFERTNIVVKVVYNAKDEITGLWMSPDTASAAYEPATYSDPEAFVERDVIVGEGEWALPGTLTLPVGEGPFPALVLVHGSGPQDRDESLGPNKPFRDLAEGLAAHGIATLRYEKRTKEHQAKVIEIHEELTVDDETVDDALAAVALLKSSAGVDPLRIHVLGHSLGGMLVPRIGVRDGDIAGFVIMAGTARQFADILVEQLEYVFSLDGTPDEDAAKMLEEIRGQVEVVNSPDLSLDTPKEELPFGIPPAYWLDLRAYQPTEMVKQIERPILVLQGGRDYQVTEEDFGLWKAALGEREDVSFKLYPDLNHIFAEGGGKAVPAEYLEPSHVAEEVIVDIAEWINGNGGDGGQ